MTDVPKTFDFGNKGEGETPPSVRKTRTLSFDTPVKEEPAPPRKPKTLDPEPVAAPALQPTRAPRTLNPESVGAARHQRAERARTLTDDLIDLAKAQDPSISMEIRGKIDILLNHPSNEMLMQWGHLNLTPLQKASTVQSEVAAEINRIDAVRVLRETKEIATRQLSFMDKLAGRSVEFFQYRLETMRTDLTALMSKSERQRKEFEPEIRDLNLDAIALTVCLNEISDSLASNIANQRVKTLIQAHQTSVMLDQLLRQTIEQCGEFVSQIETMLNVLIPNWKMALQK